ncbi:hypothetical protein ACFQS7_19060 [Dankookia sp. GCM10030260]|uniref:hypothetical protein n=1 Tax=Dankookia sp. GCM10030260 TaxID=3273390 RepID=UPI003614AB79
MAGKRGLQRDLDYAAAARLVFDAYIDFLTTPVAAAERGDPKAVTAWHGAGRSALAHLAELEKRAISIGDDTQAEEIGGLLAEARRSLADDPNEEKEDPDGDPGGAA